MKAISSLVVCVMVVFLLLYWVPIVRRNLAVNRLMEQYGSAAL